MELETRRDQFSFFLGYVARKNKEQLCEAIKSHVGDGYRHPQPSDVFEICPFNKNYKSIIRGYHIFENGKQKWFVLNLQYLLDEYLFLVSDFIPPCCGDGRTFYCHTDDGEIFLECDRCTANYDLDEHLIKRSKYKKMLKSDFNELVGEAPESDWPYHLKLK